MNLPRALRLAGMGFGGLVAVTTGEARIFFQAKREIARHALPVIRIKEGLTTHQGANWPQPLLKITVRLPNGNPWGVTPDRTPALARVRAPSV